MIRQLLHVLGIIAAWFLGATVVGAIIAMFVEVHGSILYVILAWWIGLAGAAVHVLFRLVQRLRRHDPQ